MSERISIDSIDLKKIRLLHRGRNITKANIYECLYQGQKVILKDYKDQNLLIRVTIGRWFASREFKFCRILAGISGIHKVIARPDPYSLLLDFVDGKTLSETPHNSIHPSMFASLKRIIEMIHQQGIACGDIHHRNILITEGGSIFIVDFATGWQKGHKFNVLCQFIFKKLLSLDWFAYYKIRERYAGLAPSQEERKMFQDILKFYTIGRFIKSIFYFLIEKN